MAVVAPESDEAIDAELLEIFLMEAEEVLGTVRQTMPESRSDPHSTNHLTTLRRAFHTLKGSGRMVGLNAFGEAAWSIEQALNLRLSEGHGGSASLFALIDKAAELLGAWVTDLQTQGRSSRSPGALVAAAERVMHGEPFSYHEQAAAEPVIDATAVVEPPSMMVASASEPVVDTSASVDAVDVMHLPEVDADSAPTAFELDAILLDPTAPPTQESIEAVPAEPSFGEADATLLQSAPAEAANDGGAANPLPDVLTGLTPADHGAATLHSGSAQSTPDALAPSQVDSAASHDLHTQHDASDAHNAPHGAESTSAHAETASTEAPATLHSDPAFDAVQPAAGVQAEGALDLPQVEELELSDAELAAFGQLADSGSAHEPPSHEADLLDASAHSDAAQTDVSAAPHDVPAAPIEAEIIEFPGMQSTDFKHDDNVKRIGNLEISVPLHNIYLAETDDLVRVLSHDIAEWRHEPERPVSIQAVHASHSLAGSSATVGFKVLQEVAYSLEKVLQFLARKAVPLTSADYDVLEQSVDLLKMLLQEFALGDMPLHQPAQVNLLRDLLNDLDRRSQHVEVPASEGSHPPPVDLEEAAVASDRASLIDQAQAGVHETRATTGVTTSLPHETAAAALENDATHAAAASTDDEPSATSPSIFTVTQAGSAYETADHGTLAEDADLPEQAAIAALPSASIPTPVTQLPPPVMVVERPAAFAEPVFATPAELSVDPAALIIKDDIDADLLPVFLEEGRDMLPQMGEALRSWQKDLASKAMPQSILRLLHTIKGSARMAGAMNLGQHMHETESRIEQMLRLGTPSGAALEELLARHDHGLHLFEVLQNPDAAVPPPAPFAFAAPVSQEVATASPLGVELAPVMPLHVPVEGDRRLRDRTATVAAVAAPAAPVALVRVRADMLDRLVNQAGEVSISRSKLETEVGTLRQSLGELTDNVARLRDQLREIEMQAETQMT
ncbi:MAG: Hpt domain-containing protein, partial [Pseudomonadota bacterium]|nr:Hpt domain-containing protein [Pseudomonadota bacterium]